MHSVGQLALVQSRPVRRAVSSFSWEKVSSVPSMSAFPAVVLPVTDPSVYIVRLHGQICPMMLGIPGHKTDGAL